MSISNEALRKVNVLRMAQECKLTRRLGLARDRAEISILITANGDRKEPASNQRAGNTNAPADSKRSRCPATRNSDL